MAVAAHSIDISRSPDDVFGYATDFGQFPRWQGNVVSARPEGGSARVTGSRAVVTRRAGPRRVRRAETITELTPPKTWEYRSSGGGLPVTVISKGRIEPLDGGHRSRVTITLDFAGHGIGRLLIPLVIRRQARKQLLQNTAKLKEVLERGG
jgi:uncharacterized protein YndB with AHSA1/START domain